MIYSSRKSGLHLTLNFLLKNKPIFSTGSDKLRLVFIPWVNSRLQGILGVELSMDASKRASQSNYLHPKFYIFQNILEKILWFEISSFRNLKTHKMIHYFSTENFKLCT